MFILLFMMACHMIAHRFAITPRMDFQTKGLGLGEAGVHIHGSLSQSQPNVPHVEEGTGWGTRDKASDFVVRDSVHNVANVGSGGDIDALPNLA
jgi:hypothetical protein